MTTTLHTDPWNEGDAYDRFMGRWSRRVAFEFVRWLAPAPGKRWLDVGCGTGALCAAIADSAAPASLVGVDPSEAYRRAAQARLGARAEILAGQADSLPLADASMDFVASALVFNFLPDPRAALVEFGRVTHPDGTIAACVWDYAEGMVFLRAFWDAVTSLDPAAKSADEGERFPLARRDAMRDAFAAAGCRAIEAGDIEIVTTFMDFEDYWAPFLAGQGPAGAYVAKLDEAGRDRLRERLRDVVPTAADGTITLTARAWVVRGKPPRAGG